MYTIGKPFWPERNFTYRHLLIGMVGWFAVLFSCLIALRIGGYRAALFTTLLMLLSPIFMGNVFNNHRDIPLATFTIFGIYAIIRFWEFNPVVSRKYLAYVIVALALSFASRLAGGVFAYRLNGIVFIIVFDSIKIIL
ncbi:MAG: glycosyltransferase family 39 protein [Saprospiraceae bacterium]|nr:glycosyltransferase family 39 protein [Saprospiraceae bacterium]